MRIIEHILKDDIVKLEDKLSLTEMQRDEAMAETERLELCLQESDQVVEDVKRVVNGVIRKELPELKACIDSQKR